MTAASSYSVVIPTRRPTDRLHHALRSVLAEERAGEVLVVHDRRGGEPLPAHLPGTDRRVTVLASDRPGPAATRNVGLAHASRPRVAFLDDDDLWLPGHLDRADRVLDRFAEAVLVACNAWLWHDPSPDGSAVPPADLRALPLFAAAGGEPRPVSLRELLLANRIVTPGAVLARERIAEEVRFREHLQVMEDYDLWLRLARNHTVILDPGPGVIVRRRPGSSASDHQGMAECSLAILEELAREGVLQRELKPDEVDRRLGRLWRDLAWACLARDDPAAARRAAGRLRQHLPRDLRAYVYLVGSLLPGNLRRAWFSRDRSGEKVGPSGVGSGA